MSMEGKRSKRGHFSQGVGVFYKRNLIKKGQLFSYIYDIHKYICIKGLKRKVYKILQDPLKARVAKKVTLF